MGTEFPAGFLGHGWSMVDGWDFQHLCSTRHYSFIGARLTVRLRARFIARVLISIRLSKGVSIMIATIIRTSIIIRVTHKARHCDVTTDPANPASGGGANGGILKIWKKLEKNWSD